MASKLKAAARVVGATSGASAPAQDNSVAGLVDSIRKHKKFKQLASYSIQCLEKVVAPPRIGWEVCAKQAFELNAAEDIADVCERFASDPEVFALSMSSLNALATVPRAVASMVNTSTTATLIVKAVRGFFAAIDMTRSGASLPALADDVERLGSSLRLLASLARVDAAAFEACGGITLLLDIATMAKGRNAPASAYPVLSPAITAAAAALDRASRGKGGLETLFKPAAVAALVQLATTNLNPVENKGEKKTLKRMSTMLARNKSLRQLAKSGASPSSPKAGGSSGSSNAGNSAANASGAGAGDASLGADSAAVDYNTHLEPAFRILDRLARTDTGRDLIVKSGATDMLSSIMALMARNSPLEALAMRVLAHLLGRNVSGLVDRLGGEVAGVAVSIRERVLAARLLSSLMRDEENRRTMLKNDAALLLRILELLNEDALATSDASAPMVHVLTALAAGKTDNIVVLEDMNAPALVAYLMQNRMDDPDVVAESANFFTAMIDCAEMVGMLEETTLEGSGPHAGTGEHSLLWLVVKAFSLNTHSDLAVIACLRFLEACLIYEFSPVTLVELGAIRFVTASMSTHRDDPALQALATDVLCGLADRPDHIHEMVGQDVMGQLIANLRSEGGAAHKEGSGFGGGIGAKTAGASGGGGHGHSSNQSHGHHAVPTSHAAGGEDGDEDLLARSSADAKAAQLLSAQLVASSLHLVTSVCLVGKNVKAAKDAGIIRAVLAGFSRHNQDAAVYRNFREVVSALNIEESEVTAAIGIVSSLVAKLQIAASAGDAETLRFMADYMAGLAAEGRVLQTGEAEGGDETMTGLADRILEAISLLEAVTVSPVFVCVIAAYDGVPVLIRTAGVMSAVRMVASIGSAGSAKAGVAGVAAAANALAKKAAGAAGAGGAGATVSYALADEVLSRTCNTLAHIARVAYELAGGQVAHDAEYETVDYEEYGIEEDLYSRDNIGVLCKAVANAAKPQLRVFARDSLTLLSWLASGPTTAHVRDHVDVLVSQQCIEAGVSMLRAHQSSIEICTAVAGAFSRITASTKGAIAVAQRGASRQVIRMLRGAAAAHSPAGDALLLAFLQVLEGCAAGGAEAVELLRKQNVVDALTECVDAGNKDDFFKGMEETSAGGGSSGAGGAGAGGAGSSGSNKGNSAADDKHDGVDGEGLEAYKPDPATRAEIDQVTASILSYLVGPELVRETVTFLESVALQLTQQVADGYSAKRPLRIPQYERAILIRAVIRLGLFAGTDAGYQAGTDVMEAGAVACVQIGEAALVVDRSLSASEGGSHPHNNTVEQELSYILPPCIRTIKQVLSSIAATAAAEDEGNGGATNAADAARPGTAAAVTAIPLLVSVLEEKTEHSGPALDCLASLTKNELAAGAVAGSCAGRGIAVILDSARFAYDAVAIAPMRDALWTLANVSSLPDCLALSVLAGVPQVAFGILSDSVAEAAADETAANLTLLSYLAAEASVIADLVNDGIFEVLRTALQRHCSDAYNPNEPVLYAAAMLLSKLAFADGVLSDAAGRGEEFRSTLKRIIKAAAGSTGYLDESRCMVAVLDLIADSCVPSGNISKEAADANKAAAEEAEAEETVVLAMSSSAADDKVLAAGARAMAAIGSAQRGAQLLEEIDAYASSIAEWLEAGWEASAPEVIDQIVDMTDRMRALGSNVVVSSSAAQVFPELGNTYSEVLNTIWRAVHAVCRDEMASTRAGADDAQVSVGTAGKDLHQARADTLALGAQIAGRLVQVSNVAEKTEGEEGAHVIPVAEAISMLSTVCYAARPAMEVRVLESMCRALDLSLDLKGGVCIPHMSSTGVVQSLTTILSTVQGELTKLRGGSAGYGTIGYADDDDSYLLLPADDLKRAETILITTLKNTSSKFRSTLRDATASSASDDATALLNDISVLTEILQAAAMTSGGGAAAVVSETAGGNESNAASSASGGDSSSAAATAMAAAAAEAEDRSSELYLTADSAVSCFLRVGGETYAEMPFLVLEGITKNVQTSISATGPAKYASRGRCTMSAVADVATNARVMATLVRTINHRLSLMGSEAASSNAASSFSPGGGNASVSTTIPGSLSRLEALVKTVRSATDMSFATGRKWQKASAAFLAGNKPKDAELELDPLPPKPETPAASGTEEDGEVSAVLAIWSAAAISASVAIRPSLDLLARLDASSSLSLGPEGAATTNAQIDNIAGAFAFMVQANAPSDRGAAVAAVRALARMSDMMCPDVLGRGPRPNAEGLSFRSARVIAFGKTGIYKAALLACTSTGNAEPLPGNEAYVQEVIALLAALSRYEGVDIKSLGLDKQCLTALQALARKFPNNSVVASAGHTLMSSLEDIYQEQSGAAFEATSKKALSAINEMAKSAFHRQMTAEGQMFYARMDSEDDTSQWEPPASINAAMLELVNVDKMSRVLEDEAVTAVSPAVIEGMVAALEAHAHDAGVVGVLVAALGKLAANPENHEALEACGTLDKVVANIREYDHINDPRISEGLASLVLPLSFDPFLVKNMLGPSKVAPLLIEIVKKYSNHVTTFIGSDLAWLPENAPDHNKRLHEIKAADSPDADDKNKLLPRIAQCCAQSLANLACDNDANPATGRSTVDSLVEAGAIDVLGSLMRQHRDNPRLLEDSICGLSNMAFVSDAIQLMIGRSCMDSVCAAATQYNGDAHLFQMTLRAIGNLTRTDENIVRAVGYGVFRGIVEGMSKHKENADVLKLCADVIGNMASIDDKKLPREIGIGILKECLTQAAANATAAAAAAAAAAVAAGRPRPPAPPAPLNGGTDVIALVEACENIKYAVCSLLYGDGGAKSLIDAMLGHPSRPELAASCLRALHYISSSPELIVKMVEGLALAEQVVYIMQANDTSEDVLRRGARILGGIAGVERLTFRVVDARACPVLLTAIQNQLSNREVCFLCYSVLTLLRGPAVTTAVREVRALDTTIGLFRRAVADADVEFYAVLLELMLSLSTEADMARQLAKRGARPIIDLLTDSARRGAHVSGEIDQVALFSYLMSTVSALVKAGGEASEPLLAAGLTNALLASLERVLTRRDPRVLLNRDARRSVLNVVSIMGDIIHPPHVPGEVDPLIPLNMEASECLVEEGGATALEQVVLVYKAIPDVNNPNNLLYDANTCKAAVNVLLNFEKCGYTPTMIDLAVESDPTSSTASATAAAAAASTGSNNSASTVATGASVARAAPAPPATASGAKGKSSSVPGAVSTSANDISNSKVGDLDPAVKMHVEEMSTTGRACTLWQPDGKARPVRVVVSSDQEWIIASITDGKAGDMIQVPVLNIKQIKIGNPPHVKKKMFGKSSKADKSLFLEDVHMNCLMHLETEGNGDEDRVVIATAIAAVSGSRIIPA